ncbi:Uncharacterised protein [Mycobacteroides abscessus subsp. abscessus]|nr:Uncharacterised protein [Mycobacteroides abscessus subsp. abscessus]
MISTWKAATIHSGTGNRTGHIAAALTSFHAVTTKPR